VETTEIAIETQQPVELEPLVDSAPPAVPGAAPAQPRPNGDLALVLEVPVELAVEIGRTTMTVRETLAIAPGSIIALDRMAGEPVDLLVNGKQIARGEVVAIDEEFGLRVTEVVSPQHRLSAAETQAA
jgi:flagellar motor switch protein FliN/FliY